MDDAIEYFPPRGILENYGAKGGPVQSPVRAQDPWPKSLYYTSEARSSGFHHLPGNEVSINEHSPQLLKSGSHQRFSRGDTARQPNLQHHSTLD